jgi:hypothetical protein
MHLLLNPFGIVIGRGTSQLDAHEKAAWGAKTRLKRPI